jgi:hypothetical protein
MSEFLVPRAFEKNRANAPITAILKRFRKQYTGPVRRWRWPTNDSQHEATNTRLLEFPGSNRLAASSVGPMHTPETVLRLVKAGRKVPAAGRELHLVPARG